MSDKDVRKKVMYIVLAAIISMVIGQAASVVLNARGVTVKINRNTLDISEHSKEMKAFVLDAENIAQHQAILDQVLRSEKRGKDDFERLNKQLIRNEESINKQLETLNANILKLYSK